MVGVKVDYKEGCYEKETTTTNDCYIKSGNGKMEWEPNKVGSFLIGHCHIYKINGDLYMYDTEEGIYKRDNDDINANILRIYPTCKMNFRKEVLEYIRVASPRIENIENYNYIGCRNGAYSIDDDKLLEKNECMYLMHKIDTDYNPDAYSQAMDNMLNKITCNDKQIRSLIEEMIGYCLYRECNMQVCFLLEGNGKNGKSTLLNAIKNMLGRVNYSALSFEDLGDRFRKSELVDKLANFSDDMSNVFIENDKDFKSIVTGGEITMERKYQNPFIYKNYAKLIMCANDYPKSADKSDGWDRRFIMVPLHAVISDTDPDYDPNIDKKLATEEAKSYLLNLAIAGLKRLLLRNKFEGNEKTNEAKRKSRMDNDPIYAYLEEFGDEIVLGKTADEAFEAFRNWCKEQNYKDNYCKPTFLDGIKNLRGIEAKDTSKMVAGHKKSMRLLKYNNVKQVKNQYDCPPDNI